MRMNRAPTAALNPEPDVLDNDSHIWIIEKTKFMYRTMV